MLEQARFMLDYRDCKSKESEAGKRLLKELPETSERLKELSSAMEQTQNALRFSEGITTSGPDDLAGLRDALEERRPLMEKIVDQSRSDQTSSMASEVAKLSSEVSDCLECHSSCLRLAQSVEKASIRETSNRVQKEPALVEELRPLEIPPPISAPTLVEI